jgi:hypothetical protein
MKMMEQNVLNCPVKRQILSDWLKKEDLTLLFTRAHFKNKGIKKLKG